jgi:hypothetical protein
MRRRIGHRAVDSRRAWGAWAWWLVLAFSGSLSFAVEPQGRSWASFIAFSVFLGYLAHLERRLDALAVLIEPQPPCGRPDPPLNNAAPLAEVDAFKTSPPPSP